MGWSSCRRSTESSAGQACRRAGRTDDATPSEQVAKLDSAARIAAFDAEFIMLAQGEQQQPGVLERNAGRDVQVQIGLVGDAQQCAGFQRPESIARLEPEERDAQ